MPVHNLLTTLQNGARARIRSIPLPYTKAALGITNVLLQHGFLHNVTRGTLKGPSPSDFLKAASPASRRLWVDLKYGADDHPILAHARAVSKPSRKIFLDPKELLRLVTGRRAQFVNPLQLGEVAIVRCNSYDPNTLVRSTQASQTPTRGQEEWLEAREAVGRGLGGEVVARVG